MLLYALYYLGAIRVRYCIIYMEIRDRSLFKCQGGGLKSWGVHVNFHVVTRGVAFNFDFPVVGGHVNIVDYSHKGTASILFDFPNVAGVWGGGGAKPPRLPSLISLIF